MSRSRNAFVLTLVSSLAAAQPRVIDVETAAVVQPDGGIVSVTGGAWISDERLTHVSGELVRLRTENAELKKAPPPVTGTGILIAVIVGLVVGAGLGAYGGYALSKR